MDDFYDKFYETPIKTKVIKNRKTRFKDKNGNPIYLGDVIHVEEYPGKYVGGSLDYEGVVEIDEYGEIAVGYYDIGEHESTELSHFPVAGRELYTEKQQYEYWKTAMLGGEPEENLWKKDSYRNTPYEI